MDGIQLATLITAMTPETKVLLMSGRPNQALDLKPGWQFITIRSLPGCLMVRGGDDWSDRADRTCPTMMTGAFAIISSYERVLPPDESDVGRTVAADQRGGNQ